jgi:hypothetical protein
MSHRALTIVVLGYELTIPEASFPLRRLKNFNSISRPGYINSFSGMNIHLIFRPSTIFQRKFPERIKYENICGIST